MKTVEIILKKVEDEPYVHQYTGGDSLDEAQLIVGGPVEFVHLGDRIYAAVNEEGLLLNLPYNCCGFVGNFFFVRLTNTGSFAVLSEGDKRRIFKWYEVNKHVPAPAKAGFAIKSLDTVEEFEEHSRSIQQEAERRNEEWRRM